MKNESSAYSDNLFTQTASLDDLTQNNDSYCAISMSALLAKSGVPASHRSLADNYMIIKKIYGFSTLSTRITNAERSLLEKHEFNPLEHSTIKQINEEISYLKKWSLSMEPTLRSDADELLHIRLKELKFLVSNKYPSNTSEIYRGYLALEKYFEDISKY